MLRYVIVMQNATGNTSAVYEGIRCSSDEVKTYARLGTSGQWSLTANAEWKALNDNMPSRHALAFARQGACKDHYAPSKADIIEALQARQRTSPTYKNN